MPATAAVLSSQQVQQYAAEGYTFAPGLISAGELAELRQVLVEIVQGQRDETWPQRSLQVANPEQFTNPRGGPLAWGVQLPSRHHPAFAAVAGHPQLAGAMAQLLGGPVQQHTDQALIKHPGMEQYDGGRTFYHQDSWYWKLAPKLGCNAWIALDEVGVGSIALALLPGSQAGWELEPHESYYDNPTIHSAVSGQAFMRHRIPSARVDASKEVLLPMRPGDAAFFSNFTWHRAEPNLSGEHKMAYAVAYRRIEQPEV